MARTKSIGIRERLARLLPDKWLREKARATGAVQRSRKVDIVSLFWTVVLGFGAGKDRTLAGLRRTYEVAKGHRLVPSAFYGCFSEGFSRFLREILAHLMDKVAEPPRSLKGAWRSFRDVVLADATAVRLHDLLAGAFPACRTNHTKAAAKMHVVMSVVGQGPRSVKLTQERLGDGRCLRIGAWVKERLLLFDLGYYRFQLFARIADNSGYFISRCSSNSSPTTGWENCRAGKEKSSKRSSTRP